ncbi:MAG: YcxB family protein [Pseudomonadota bacterium]
MTEPDTLQLRISRNHADTTAMQFWGSLLTGWRGWWIRHGIFVIFAASFFGALANGWWLYCVVRPAPQAFHGYVVGLCAAVAFLMAAILIQNAFIARRLRPKTEGLRQSSIVSLSADGITESWGRSRLSWAWDEVLAVRTVGRTTLLLTGEGEGVLIPDRALPEELDATAFHNRIAIWRKGRNAE